MQDFKSKSNRILPFGSWSMSSNSKLLTSLNHVSALLKDNVVSDSEMIWKIEVSDDSKLCFEYTQNLSSYSRKHLPIGRYLSKVGYLNQPIGKYWFANMMMSDLLTYWFIVVLIYRQKVLYICLYVYHSFEQTLERSNGNPKRTLTVL